MCKIYEDIMMLMDSGIITYEEVVAIELSNLPVDDQMRIRYNYICNGKCDFDEDRDLFKKYLICYIAILKFNAEYCRNNNNSSSGGDYNYVIIKNGYSYGSSFSSE